MSMLNGIYVDSEGNISCRKGDSGYIAIIGLPDDENYTISLGIYDPKTKEILREISMPSGGETEVQMAIPVSFTESVGVGRFFYGIKLTDTLGEEQTVIPNSYMDAEGHIEIGAPQTFIVRPKLSEGAQE